MCCKMLGGARGSGRTMLMLDALSRRSGCLTTLCIMARLLRQVALLLHLVRVSACVACLYFTHDPGSRPGRVSRLSRAKIRVRVSVI